MFLFRTLERVDETYPSLVAAARRSPSPRVTAREGGEGEDVASPEEPEGEEGVDVVADRPEAAVA